MFAAVILRRAIGPVGVWLVALAVATMSGSEQSLSAEPIVLMPVGSEAIPAPALIVVEEENARTRARVREQHQSEFLLRSEHIYIAWEDLNRDGVDEALVGIGHSAWCGSIGCPVDLFQVRDGTWEDVGGLPVDIQYSAGKPPRMEIEVDEGWLNGYRVLRARETGGFWNPLIMQYNYFCLSRQCARERSGYGRPVLFGPPPRERMACLDRGARDVPAKVQWRIHGLAPEGTPCWLSDTQWATAYDDMFDGMFDVASRAYGKPGHRLLERIEDSSAASALAAIMGCYGAGDGTSLTQRAINETVTGATSAHIKGVDVDGVFGPRTLAAYTALADATTTRPALLEHLARLRAAAPRKCRAIDWDGYIRFKRTQQ